MGSEGTIPTGVGTSCIVPVGRGRRQTHGSEDPPLRGGEAGEEEAEEGVGIGFEADLSIERSWGVGGIGRNSRL